MTIIKEPKLPTFKDWNNYYIFQCNRLDDVNYNFIDDFTLWFDDEVNLNKFLDQLSKLISGKKESFYQKLDMFVKIEKLCYNKPFSMDQYLPDLLTLVSDDELLSDEEVTIIYDNVTRFLNITNFVNTVKDKIYFIINAFSVGIKACSEYIDVSEQIDFNSDKCKLLENYCPIDFLT